MNLVPRMAVWICASAAVVSCGGGSTDSSVPTTPTPVAVATVSISPGGGQLLVGATLTLAATPLSAAGAPLSGRTTTWTTSTAAVATVNAGVVTAVSPGSANVTATIEGVSASVAVTVTAPLPGLVDLVAGDNQRGIAGRAHADSLTVRVRTAGGANAVGASVTWIATGGTLSSGTSVTDANGLSRVQWTAGMGDLTVTATASGAAPVTFRANGRTSGACELAPSPASSRFSLGPTDHTLSLRAALPLKFAVLFVDFPDAAATETPASLVSLIVEPGLALLRELSYNRLNITTTTFPKWYRMAKPIGQYDWTTYLGHRTYIDEVLTIADTEIDFSTFDALYIFAPPNANKPISPTFNGGNGSGVVHDGRNFGNAVTFGRDSRNFPAAIVAHETGHMLGLPDLYTFDASGTPYTGNQFRYIGAWSLMSNVFNPGHYLIWEKRKLGFLDPQQADCLEGPGGEEVVIQPNAGTTGGLKMVAVKLDASRALVVEVRNDLGLDANMCAAGVLVYEVNAAAQSGYGPAAVRGSRITTTGAQFNKCGPWADGVYGTGAGAVSTYTDAPSGTTVTVLGTEAGGAYRVRVRRL